MDYWSRTWLVVEEAQVSQGTALYDNIKSFTGTDEIDTDRKHENVSKHKIPAQLIMVSNRPPAFIENTARRFFVSCWRVHLERWPQTPQATAGQTTPPAMKEKPDLRSNNSDA